MNYDLLTLNGLTDEELIQLVQNRNEAAFSELMSRYNPRIWRIVVAKSRQHQDAEEILMNVWIAVWENIDGLREVGSFGAWLRRIANNACTRYYTSTHRSRNEIPHSDAELVEHIDQHAPTRFREVQLRTDVREAVYHLPQRVRQIAVLYYLEAWNIKDIAQKLDIALGTVKTKLREIRSLLRKEFGVEPIEGGIMAFESTQMNNHQNYFEGYLPKGAIARFGKGYIFDLEFSPDGTRFAIGSTIGIWLYDTKTGEELNLLTGHTYYVTGVVFSPDGKTLASISGWNDHTIRLWDAVTGEPKATLTGHTDEIYSLVFSPDGKTFACASKDKTIRLWDGVTGKPKTTLIGHTDKVNVLRFNPDGSRLASGGDDEVIRFWDVATGELQLTFAAHPNSIDSLIFSPNGKMIASQGGDNNVCLWDTNTGEFLRIFKDNTKDISSIDFSKDGGTLAIVSSDKTIRLWNTHTGEKIKMFNWETKLYCVQYSPDGRTFACDVDDGTMLLFDANAGELLHTFKIPGGRNVNGFRYSPDSRTLAVSNGLEIYFWDVDTGEQKNTITGYAEVLKSLMFSPNGKKLVSLDDIVRIWNVDTHKLLKTLSAERSISSIAYSPDGETLACGTYDNTIMLYSVGTLERKATFEEHTKGISSVIFSPDGQTLASGSWDDTIRLWDVHTSKCLISFKTHTRGIYDVVFSPKGSTLASGGDDGTIRFWNAATGELLKTIDTQSDNSIDSMAYSPDGMILACTGNNGDEGIRFWDVSTGELLKTIKAEAGAYSVVYSPDGSTFASGGMGELSVWDVATGDLLKTFTGHIDPVYSVAYSPDGRILASGCRDSTVILWDLTK